MSNLASLPTGERQTFVHEALIYRDHATYLNCALRFIYDALAADEPVLVASPPANVTLLSERLGPCAAEVRFEDMTAAGRNPGRIIPWVLSAFMEEHEGRPVRIIGEPIWAARSVEEYSVCVQHEAMINVAFTGRTATILCPYDASTLKPNVLTDAEHTHPVVIDRGDRVPSRLYDPHGIAEHYNRPLPEPPPGATTLRFESGDLGRVRRLVAAEGARAGLRDERVDDLRSAVNELATNSVAHGGGSGTLRTWITADRVVCEVRDFGHIGDAMAGRRRPATLSVTGRGLVLVHYLCDLVQTYSGPTGTATRLHMLRPGRSTVD
jgi:anti-sigma regulatory factor (Ser/Thr protein kinase)